MSDYVESGVLEYFSFRLSTHLNYRTKVSVGGQDYRKMMKFVQQDLPTSALSVSDDPKSLLELGIRQWTGFGAPQDRPGALALWTTIVSTREDVPLSLKARAYSCLAKGWLDRACKKGPTISVDHLYDAGTSANEAVALGLISEVALIVAESIQSSGFRLREGSKHPEESTERFEQLIDLWEALDARDAERAEAKLKKEEKVMRDPLGYFCAAEDCGIVATKKSTLWRCGGGCPRVLKPSYCSKDCQVADRKHHRLFCRPGATVSSVCPANSADETAVDRRSRNPRNASCEAEGFRPGAERTIIANLPGGAVLQISSDAMSPQTMRWMKDSLEKGTGTWIVRWLD